jgi:hypothetical protein
MRVDSKHVSVKGHGAVEVSDGENQIVKPVDEQAFSPRCGGHSGQSSWPTPKSRAKISRQSGALPHPNRKTAYPPLTRVAGGGDDLSGSCDSLEVEVHLG